MKRLTILLTLLISLALNLQAQETWTHGVFQDYLDVGGARNDISSKKGLNLDLGHNTMMQFTSESWSASNGILFNAYKNPDDDRGGLASSNEVLYAYDAGKWGNGAGAIIFNGNGGTMHFMISGSSSGEGNSVKWNGPKMSILRNGNVGVGTNNPDLKFTVKGKIKAREVKVDASAGADYVFEKDYNLPTLSKIEAHIKKHQHLPDIPSAEKMKANGLDIGKFSINLLKNLEEQVLHNIEQEKTIRKQSGQIEALERDVKNLKESNQKLKDKYKTLLNRIEQLENKK